MKKILSLLLSLVFLLSLAIPPASLAEEELDATSEISIAEETPSVEASPEIIPNPSTPPPEESYEDDVSAPTDSPEPSVEPPEESPAPEPGEESGEGGNAGEEPATEGALPTEAVPESSPTPPPFFNLDGLETEFPTLFVGEALDLSLLLVAPEKLPLIQWTIADEAVAAIDEVGIVTALSPGQTIIQAEIPGESNAELILMVLQAPVAEGSPAPQVDADGDASSPVKLSPPKQVVWWNDGFTLYWESDYRTCDQYRITLYRDGNVEDVIEGTFGSGFTFYNGVRGLGTELEAYMTKEGVYRVGVQAMGDYDPESGAGYYLDSDPTYAAERRIISSPETILGASDLQWEGKEGNRYYYGFGYSGTQQRMSNIPRLYYYNAEEDQWELIYTGEMGGWHDSSTRARRSISSSYMNRAGRYAFTIQMYTAQSGLYYYGEESALSPELIVREEDLTGQPDSLYKALLALKSNYENGLLTDEELRLAVQEGSKHGGTLNDLRDISVTSKEMQLYQELDNLYASRAGITVNAIVTGHSGSVFERADLKIVGAAFNADSTQSVVTIELDINSDSFPAPAAEKWGQGIRAPFALMTFNMGGISKQTCPLQWVISLPTSMAEEPNSLELFARPYEEAGYGSTAGPACFTRDGMVTYEYSSLPKTTYYYAEYYLSSRDPTMPVSGIQLYTTAKQIDPGDSFALETAFIPFDAGNRRVTWASSNAAVAPVSAEGVVTGLSGGKATITATTEEGGYTATCEVTVTGAAAPTATPTATPTVVPTATPTAEPTAEPSATPTAEPTAEPSATPMVIPVASVKLSATAKTLTAVGKTFTLKSTLSPVDATNKAVTWKSSDTKIATVDKNGKVTAKKTGAATITVTTADGGKTATCKVYVGKAVTGVTLNSASKTLKVDASFTLKATLAPTNAANKTVTWKSSNTAIATVSSGGKVTGKAVGDVTITATTQDGSKTAKCTVKVRPAVTGVKLNVAQRTVKVGAAYTLKATISPSNAAIKTITWKSSNTKIATVDKNGKVTGIKKGKVTITATTTDGKKVSTAKLYIGSPVTKIKFSAASKTLKTGNSTTVKPVFTPADAQNKTLTWKSSNTAIATVNSSSGKVTGKAVGDAKITATSQDGKKVASYTVKVRPAVTSVKLSVTTKTVEVGKTATLKATVSPSNAAIKTVAWKSSNTKIATVDKNGKVTGIKAGSATITATTTDGKKVASCALTIRGPIYVWKSATGSKYHDINNCGNMNPNKAVRITLAEAKRLGLGWCDNCHPPLY